MFLKFGMSRHFDRLKYPFCRSCVHFRICGPRAVEHHHYCWLLPCCWYFSSPHQLELFLLFHTCPCKLQKSSPPHSSVFSIHWLQNWTWYCRPCTNSVIRSTWVFIASSNVLPSPHALTTSLNSSSSSSLLTPPMFSSSSPSIASAPPSSMWFCSCITFKVWCRQNGKMVLSSGAWLQGKRWVGHTQPLGQGVYIWGSSLWQKQDRYISISLHWACMHHWLEVWFVAFLGYATLS